MELHGRFYLYRALHGPGVDFLASVSWLRFSDLFGETEGFVSGAQTWSLDPAPDTGGTLFLILLNAFIYIVFIRVGI